MLSSQSNIPRSQDLGGKDTNAVVSPSLQPEPSTLMSFVNSKEIKSPPNKGHRDAGNYSTAQTRASGGTDCEHASAWRRRRGTTARPDAAAIAASGLSAVRLSNENPRRAGPNGPNRGRTPGSARRQPNMALRRRAEAANGRWPHHQQAAIWISSSRPSTPKNWQIPRVARQSVDWTPY